MLLYIGILYFFLLETEMKVLRIFLKKPVNIGNKEVMKIEIHFELQFDIAQASIKALGEDRQVVASLILFVCVYFSMFSCLLNFHVGFKTKI